MEARVRGIQPRSLTNEELVRLCDAQLQLITGGLTHAFQLELLRRFAEMACTPIPSSPVRRFRHGQLSLLDDDAD